MNKTERNIMKELKIANKKYADTVDKMGEKLEETTALYEETTEKLEETTEKLEETTALYEETTEKLEETTEKLEETTALYEETLIAKEEFEKLIEDLDALLENEGSGIIMKEVMSNILRSMGLHPSARYNPYVDLERLGLIKIGEVTKSTKCDCPNGCETEHVKYYHNKQITVLGRILGLEFSNVKTSTIKIKKHADIINFSEYVIENY